MSNYCLDCFNKNKNTDLAQDEVVLSPELKTCEGCNEEKNVIIKIKHVNVFRRKHTDAKKRPKSK